MTTRNSNQLAVSSANASETMQVFQYSSGGRTRGVVNIVNPGTTGTKAYTVTGNVSAPTAATDGFANFRQQKYVHWTLDTGGTNDDGADVAKLKLWVYNSFSGIWSKLQAVTNTDADAVTFSDYEVIIGNGTTNEQTIIIPVEGAERIAVEVTNYATGGTALSIDVYLGVNTF